MRIRHPHLALAFLLSTGAAHAQASDIDKAQAHFAAGRQLRASGRCDLAIEEFARATDFEPNKVGPRLNLGDCYVELGRLPEAFRQFKEAERIAELTKDERRLANARAASAQVEAKMVRVVLREEEARVANVRVDVDGTSIGTAPWHIVVAPGAEHDIRASAPDGRKWSGKAKGGAGEVVRLTIALTADDTPREGEKNRAGSELPPEEKVVARPAERSTVPWRALGWAGTGLGVVGIGLGATFGILAASDKSDAACEGGFCEREALASARRNATIANVGFIAGGALLAGGVAILVLAPKGRPAETATRVKVQGTGIVVEGRW